MKYANYDEVTHKILGWYSSDVHMNIPTPKIEISDEVWQNAINNNHNKVNEDGTTETYDFRTEDEVKVQTVVQKVFEYKTYLIETDFKMTVDYYATLTPDEQVDLTTKRAEARDYIRANDVSGS